MKIELLNSICEQLTMRGTIDMSKSIVQTRADLSLDSGFMKMLSYLPESNLQSIADYIGTSDTFSTTSELYNGLLTEGLLEFTPYFYEFEKLGPTIVCAINKFIAYRDCRFQVVTNPEAASAISVSRGDVSILIDRMSDEISTDCYNALVAEIICTAYMCPELRKWIRVDGKFITEFLRAILTEVKALPVYSVDTFRSKISWVNLAHRNNQNFLIGNTYNLSIGADGVTLEYLSPLGVLEHTAFIFESDKLESYDTQFNVRSVYFAYALYLLVSDVFNTEFPYGLRTGISYKPVDDILDLYNL